MPTSEGMRFRILRPHAQGGIGKVSVAFDAELQREVALKQIKQERADDADSRTRFLLEAEVTGRLEHPGIVPVYGLGIDDDGRPFYAMRFVRGTSFEEAIQPLPRADEDPRRDPRERSLALRHLLDRFVNVCQTVAYAHSRGVLHRDLKPANILLGPFNESLVVDWGLAKVFVRGPGETGRPKRARPARAGRIRAGRDAAPDRAGRTSAAGRGPRAGRLPGDGPEPGFVRAAARVLELDRHGGGDRVRHAGLHEPRAGRRPRSISSGRPATSTASGRCSIPSWPAGRRSTTSGATSRRCWTGSGWASSRRRGR